MVLNPLGGDQAAHAYLTRSVSTSGLGLWDNFWYAGRYEYVNYSVLYYPLATLLGARALVVTSIVASSAGMALLLWALAGPRARLAALLFGASCSFQLVIGQYPFAVGAACAIWAGVAIVGRRVAVASALGIASAAASPLAFLFLLVVVLGAALGSRHVRGSGTVRRAGAGLLVAAAVVGLVIRAFPDGGRYPYTVADLLRLLAFCAAAAWLLRSDPVASAIRGAVLLYALVAVAAFAVPSEVGSNLERLANYVALPLAAILLSRRGGRRTAAVAVLLPTSLSLQLMPAADALARSFDAPATEAAFWSGATRFLVLHANPDYRVEVVPTSAHWESYYLAARGIPLARGWFRQDDYPLNARLYSDDLSAAGYRAWLDELAIGYVVVPHASLDSGADHEAALVTQESGSLDLRRVFDDGKTTIYAVGHPVPLVTGTTGTSARVVALTRTTLAVALFRPGTYLLRMRYTPYWRVEGSGACIAPAGASGLTDVVVPRAGTYDLRFTPSESAMVGEILGTGERTCTARGVP